MVIVRDATANDLARYVDLAQEFHDASPMHGVAPFEPEGYSVFFLNAIDNPDIGIWLAELNGAVIGIAGALIYPLYFSPTKKVAQELWWWLTPQARGTGAGGAMFKKIKEWSAQNNATAIFMIALEDERAGKMEKLYRRAGFRPLERTFIKEVM
jgi:GNAT superfamily N-acetyltransferase